MNEIKIGDYNMIMSDRNIFNQIVYTPLSEALRLLNERNKDRELLKIVEKNLIGNIPEIFKEKKLGVLCRQIATPNNETRRFISIAKDNDLYPLLLEYHEDKFTSNNTYKHSLGRLHVQKNDASKNSDSTHEEIIVVDFQKYDGKKLKDVKTMWDEPLLDFHRRLFLSQDYKKDELHFYDVSSWLKNNGGSAIKYYANLLSLFVCNGILFENFLMSKDGEGDFTRNIVLPAIEHVMEVTGVKPLIVPFEPIDLENENFWLCHLSKVKDSIPKK